MADDDRVKSLKAQKKELDPSNPDHMEIKEILEAELFQLTGKPFNMGGMVRGYNMGGMAGGYNMGGMMNNRVMPTNKMTGRRFMKGGMAYNKPEKMNMGGEVSRGGRKSMQGIKFRGLK